MEIVGGADALSQAATSGEDLLVDRTLPVDLLPDTYAIRSTS